MVVGLSVVGLSHTSIPTHGGQAVHRGAVPYLRPKWHCLPGPSSDPSLSNQELRCSKKHHDALTQSIPVLELSQLSETRTCKESGPAC